MATLVTSAIRHNSAASNNVVLDSNGRVGIGTATPAARLDVSGGGIIGGELFTNSTADALELYAGTAWNTGGAAISIRGTTTGFNNHGMEFYAGGNERMRIDSSGRVTKPLQPMFYARGAETNYTLTNGADMPFNNAVFNIGSHFNASTFRFTAPVAGYYFIAFHLFVQTVTNRVSLKVNNNAFHNNQMQVSPGTNSWAGVISLAANDFVTVGDWQSTSGAMFYMGHCTFSGYLLG